MPMKSAEKLTAAQKLVSQCDRCGTAWEYENDKNNQKAGWSVVGR